MKSLKIIQTMSKVGKILSMIAFIGSIVGICGCAVGIAAMLTSVFETVKIGGITLHGLIDRATDFNALYSLVAGWLIICIGEAVLARFAVKYFNNELQDGTPFTESGSKEILRLGILTVALPLASQILAQIAQAVIAEYAAIELSPEMTATLDCDGSVTLGICFIILSVIFKYGTELKTENE